MFTELERGGAAGLPFHPAYVHRFQMAERQIPGVEEVHCPLTRKETHLLRLLAQGYSNQALADKLFVARSTIRAHLRNIYAKLGANSRTQAVAFAHRKGLIDVRVLEEESQPSANQLKNEFSSASWRNSTDQFENAGELSSRFTRLMRRPESAGDAVDSHLSCRADHDRPILTAREFLLLQLLSEGHSNKDLANRIFVSMSTVRTHLRHIYAKLGASNRIQTVALGRRHGFIR